MKKLIMTVSILGSILSLAALPVEAFDKPNKAKAKGKSEHKVEKIERPRHFSDHDVRIIRDFYHDHDYYQKKRKALPPGLQKKYQRTGQLPPGWAKKFQRGEVLPLDIYRLGRPLPYDLYRQLPVGPVGSKVLEIEGKIFRVINNTREILDILDLGF